MTHLEQIDKIFKINYNEHNRLSAIVYTIDIVLMSTNNVRTVHMLRQGSTEQRALIMSGSSRRSVASMRYVLSDEESAIVNENVNRVLSEMGLTRVKRNQTSIIAQKSCENLTRVAYEKHYRGRKPHPEYYH
jgi:hypothetical protein